MPRHNEDISLVHQRDVRKKFGGGMIGKLDMLHFVVIKMLNRWIFSRQYEGNYASATPFYLLILVPSIFYYFKEGALGIANPQLLFFFLFLFFF